MVYRIARPHERIGDVNQRALAEEALLNEAGPFLMSGLPPPDQRRMADLPVLSHPAQPGLSELQPAGRGGLVAVCVVWQALRVREVAAAFNAPRPAVVVQRTEAPALPAPTPSPTALNSPQPPERVAAAAKHSRPGAQERTPRPRAQGTRPAPGALTEPT